MSYDDGPYDFQAYDPDDDGDDLVVCEECGAEVYALGDRCPKCGYWMVQGVGAERLDIRRPYRNVRLIAWGLLLLFAIMMFFGLIVPLFSP